jgi:DNA-binding transcriptional LysR family regulator
MDIRLLNTFISVASISSFTQAAEKLGYAQSTVTAQVQALEDDLGVKLFERLGKSIFLTPEGERLLPYAKQVLKLCEEARSAVAPPGAVAGTLAVGAPESLCTVRLLPLFTGFHGRYPDVELVLKFGGSYQFPAMLKENAIDVAIYIERIIYASDLISKARIPERIVLLAPSGHPLSNAARVLPGDLAGQTMILTEAGCSYRSRFMQVMGEAGASLKSTMESGNVEVMKQLAASGLGIALLPRVAALGELASGRLVELRWAGASLDLFTQVVYHKDKWLTPAMRAFLRMAEETLSPAEDADRPAE